MILHFSGTYSFTDPNTSLTYFVEYKGNYYNKAKTGNLVLKDLPSELEEFRSLIEEDIWDYETKT